MLQESQHPLREATHSDAEEELSSMHDEMPGPKENLNDSLSFRVGPGISSRKRREIKVERDEIACLYYDLISLINKKVDQIENEGERARNAPKVMLPLKNKKSIKFRKQEPEKSCPAPAPTVEEPSALRKNSLKQDKAQADRCEREKKMKQIFANYNHFMTYRINEESDEQISELKGIQTKSSVKDNNLNSSLRPLCNIQSSSLAASTSSAKSPCKIFSVFQQVSLTINPLGPTNRT